MSFIATFRGSICLYIHIPIGCFTPFAKPKVFHNESIHASSLMRPTVVNVTNTNSESWRCDLHWLPFGWGR